jgi:hypothetical protein
MILLRFRIATNKAPLCSFERQFELARVALGCYSGVGALPDSPEAVATTRKARPARRAFHLRYGLSSLHSTSNQDAEELAAGTRVPAATT